MNKDELTLLSKKEIFGENDVGQLDVLKKYGTKCAITDLGILTGNRYSYICLNDDKSLKGRTGFYWTQSSYGTDVVICVKYSGLASYNGLYNRTVAIRPVLLYLANFNSITKNRIKGYNGTEEVEYGEYPQYAPSGDVQELLEQELQKGNLSKTGKTYTFDSTKYDEYNKGFQPVTYDEYEYRDKKYIRIKVNSCYDSDTFQLSNGEFYKDGDNVWIEVSPIRWLIDDKTKTLISKRGLVSGIRLQEKDKPYNGDFKTTEMYMFLNTYLKKDMFLNETKQISLENPKEISNPYELKFDKVSEEDIIKGAIDSDVAVFLHGPSSEGKSARVKQIDPDCVIIYLRNATPESLNGKSVYNQKQGKMIDIKPTWLKKLETICEKEPDKLHILFFDELTNALPSIQGIAFNIILDKEVNGIWKLPANARIVAAGNEMEESLSANELAEPLFNRFAHVYIKTSTESWLKWASANKIHPTIYSFIAYKNGEVLRSQYDGEKPNADPRKWEMASKMLYATGNPEMLRALVGEEITKEFVAYCQTKVITLEDVLTGNYNDVEIKNSNTAQKYATVASLTQVDEDNYEKVKDFIFDNIGKEYIAAFDSMWSKGKEKNLKNEVILLTKEQILANDIIKKIGSKCVITDFAIVLGSYGHKSKFHGDNIDNSLIPLIGNYYLSSSAENQKICIINEDGDIKHSPYNGCRSYGIRPVISAFTIPDADKNKMINENGIIEVEYGWYPQYAVSNDMAKELEQAYNSGILKKTGKTYTTDSRKRSEDDIPFDPMQHEEYEYMGKKYIRFFYRNQNVCQLSNGNNTHKGENIWLEVAPIKWYVDYTNKLMISKNIIVAGVRFDANKYAGNFKTSEMYMFLNRYFAKDVILDMTEEQKISLQESKY